MNATAATIVPPIITLGPAGYLAAEGSVEDAVAHLTSAHPERDGAGRSEVLSSLQHYDSTGRRLRLEASDGTYGLLPEDTQIPRGALCALIDAAFAHARARAYEDESLLEGSGITHASKVRPPPLPDAEQPTPTDDAFTSFLDVLVEQVQADPEPDGRRGSWWHNLFYH